MVSIKNEKDIECLRKAGKIVVDALNLVRDNIRPGVDTLTLDMKAEKLIADSGARPAFKGYTVPGVPKPFPGTLCISINDEVVHGIPSEDRVLEEGDIVSIDVGVRIDGFYGDAAYTFPVGRISPEREALLKVTRECLERAISVAREGATLGDVGHAVESWAAPRGYGIVRNYAGHGIGRNLHEAPQIPNFGVPGRGITLKKGMSLAIEPMIMTGKEEVRTLKDRWTVVTADGSDAAHFEKTIVITGNDPEVITPWE
ncbi:MAG TPA: type I methionyl aminopeptidase [Synergistales bacterium]|jgi:methionyl aminopeptidase|nr:MAG: Methionine aminopeptidase [Synergistales bacterium 57_84]KUK87736.1 MAG: Methionine aminopeptidase [Synergistales bacterium 58_81]HCR38413.1 type I methionyl aminopeptidase [Synergistaceae bacterium]HPA58878.1 type I methionyl aminopeptidase [Synergistales bacterium]HQO82962.1 type I methionyl aminopeptidase [Synergistales bacterium]